MGASWLSSPATPGTSADDLTLANGQVRVTLREDGLLASVYHLPTGREMLRGPGNRFRTFLDRPQMHDAEEIAADYERLPLEPPRCIDIQVVERGPHRSVLRTF